MIYSNQEQFEGNELQLWGRGKTVFVEPLASIEGLIKNENGLPHKRSIYNPPPRHEITIKMRFGRRQTSLYISLFQYTLPIFLIFALFRQFAILNFGTDPSGSQPFNLLEELPGYFT